MLCGTVAFWLFLLAPAGPFHAGGGIANLQPSPPATFVIAHAGAGMGDSDAGQAEKPETGWGHFARWVGHFHPPLTEFPIALVIAGAIAELLWMLGGAPWLEGAARYCTILAGIAAAITAPLGWAFATVHGEGSWVLETHRWLGTAGAIWLLALLVVCEISHRRGTARGLYRAGLFLAVPAVVAIGFFGGAMVYGLHEYDWNRRGAAAQTAEPVTPETTSQDHTASSAASQPAVTIAMTDDMSFKPAKITVPLGATVRWINRSEDDHTVTADPKQATDAKDVSLPKGAEPFASGKIKPGGTFEHRFTVPGVYKYVCVPHEDADMLGQITVSARSPTTAP